MKNQNRASDDEGVLRLDAAECAELESALDAEASVIPELARLFGRHSTTRAVLDELTGEAAAAGLYETDVDYAVALKAARKRERSRE